MHLVAAPVVRLVRTLAHELTPEALMGPSSNRVARRKTSPVSRTTGTACPRGRTPFSVPDECLARGPVVDMRHRSNRFRPANGTRRPSTGSIRARGNTWSDRTGDRHSTYTPDRCDTPSEPRNLWRTGCPTALLLLASGDRAHPKSGQARSISRSRTLHTLWTKVWIGTCGPTRRNSRGLDLRTDVSDEGNARRTWSQQQRTAENLMCCGPQSWTVWLPTSASGWLRASR